MRKIKKNLLLLVGIINIILIYFLEHPNKLDIPSSKQMGFFRALLNYNDFVYESIDSYLVLIIILMLILFTIVISIKKVTNYIVLIYLVILSGSIFLFNYNNPYIYFVLVCIEFFIYSIIVKFIEIKEKNNEKKSY